MFASCNEVVVRYWAYLVLVCSERPIDQNELHVLLQRFGEQVKVFANISMGAVILRRANELAVWKLSQRQV